MIKLSQDDSDTPTVLGVPDGMTAYILVVEDDKGGTETLPVVGVNIVEAVTAAYEWAKAHNHTVKTVAEWGWTEGLVGC